MELIADRDPQKPVDLTEMKSAKIGSVFPIICCINKKGHHHPGKLGIMHPEEGTEGNVGGARCAPE
jgi:hypothetical protein